MQAMQTVLHTVRQSNISPVVSVFSLGPWHFHRNLKVREIPGLLRPENQWNTANFRRSDNSFYLELEGFHMFEESFQELKELF